MSYTNNTFNVKNFGAKGDGVADDTAAIQSAQAATVAAGGGTVFLPAGTYNVSSPINWTSGLASLVGVGDASKIAVTASITTALNITSGNSGTAARGLFQDFIVISNGNVTTAGIYQSVTTENSIGTRYLRVKSTGATGSAYQFANDRCEDVSYIDCATDGNENSTTTVNRAIRINVPNGMCRIVGGELFGRNDLTFQQIEYVGAVAGPIYINSGSAAQVLSMQGCYLYDGGTDGFNCIDTGTSLSNITADGCYFVQQNQTSFVNGNIPTGASLVLRNCVWIQAATTGTTINLVQASGAGMVSVEGGKVSLNNATTVNLFNPVSSPTTFVNMPIICTGVTNTGTAATGGLPVFNVRAYGATGNGTTDDTTAIQAAITASTSSTGGTVFFPAGNYITQPLSLPPSTVLQGVNGQAYSFDNSGNPNSNNVNTLSQLTLKTPGSSATITTVAQAGTTATITTSVAHGYSPGQWVTIWGLTHTTLDGVWKMVTASGSTFTFTLASATITSTSDSGTALNTAGLIMPDNTGSSPSCSVRIGDLALNGNGIGLGNVGTCIHIPDLGQSNFWLFERLNIYNTGHVSGSLGNAVYIGNQNAACTMRDSTIFNGTGTFGSTPGGDNGIQWYGSDGQMWGCYVGRFGQYGLLVSGGTNSETFQCTGGGIFGNAFANVGLGGQNASFVDVSIDHASQWGVAMFTATAANFIGCIWYAGQVTTNNTKPFIHVAANNCILNLVGNQIPAQSSGNVHNYFVSVGSNTGCVLNGLGTTTVGSGALGTGLTDYTWATTTPTFPATTVSATNTTGADVQAFIANGTGAITVVKLGGITTGLTVAASGTQAIRIPNGQNISFTYASGTPTWTWIIG